MIKRLFIQTNEVAVSCLFTLLLFTAEFISTENSIDVIGPQWLYLSAITTLFLIVIFYMKPQNCTHVAIGSVFPLGVLIAFLLLLMALSIINSINRVESMVSISRWLIFSFSFFSLLISFKNNITDLLKAVSPIIAIVVSCQCVHELSVFFEEAPSSGLAKSILSMGIGLGNKNIFASSILLKIPFLFYLHFFGKSFPKIVTSLLLSICIYTVLLLNARAAYLSLIVQCLLLLHFAVLNRSKIWPRKQSGKVLVAYFLLAFAIAVGGSMITVDYFQPTGNQLKSNYGNVLQRLSTIDPGTAKGTGNRRMLYKIAVAIIKERPLTGVGIGNWKIASIPYERTSNFDVVVNYHAHNDFLELTGEIGIAGGVGYLLIFAIIAYLYFQQIKKINFNYSKVLLISALGISSYFIDSCFNFPSERASIQMSFAFWLSCFQIVIAPTMSFIKSRASSLVVTIGKFIFLVLALVTWFISYRTYQSLTLQKKFFGYSYLYPGRGKYTIKDFDEYNSSIPNITQTTIPINELRAELLILDNQFDSSLSLLRNCPSVNPEIGYHDYLQSVIFLKESIGDSAVFYARKAFSKRPLNIAHWRQVCLCAIFLQDSILLKDSYEQYSRCRNDKLSVELYHSSLESIRKELGEMKAK